jgi:uncharacterized protein (TIGR00299 family) protein
MAKTAYFDCFSGISGDMFIGSLLDAGLDFELLKAELGKIGLPECNLEVRKVSKQHISCTKFDVLDDSDGTYRHLPDLNLVVDESNFGEDVKAKAKAIFLKIAKAESKIHDISLEKVHFHEIAAVDTIIDVVGAIIGLKLLGIERVISSSLNVGSGTVTFSHGTYPVPAPATAEILKDVPVYTSDSRGELVTPTGAAIISSLASQFGDMPEMRVHAVGYGAGARDADTPNALRVYIGETAEPVCDTTEGVVVFETNIDDMNPQMYEHVQERLMEEGALDAFLTQIVMKKGRPGVKLTILAKPGTEANLVDIVLRETTSIGVRIRHETRRTLERKFVSVDTELGVVRVKVSSSEGQVLNRMPEYEDCRKIARDRNISLQDVYHAVEKAMAQG